MVDPDNYTPEQQMVRVAATIDQPDKFAKVFCEAAKSQKTIDDALKTVVKSLVQHDKETRDFIKSIQRELEKEDWWLVLKKFGLLGWTLIVAILGAIAGGIVRGVISH